MNETVSFGSQEQRPPDGQPDRLVMRAPDGRTVQVMTGDVAEFAERGFRIVNEPGAKAKRSKSTAPDSAEEASA